VKQVGRYMLWAILLEILSRFLYASSIQFSPEIYEKLDTWTMCGLGFSLPLIFFLKYQVLYGLAGSIAAFDKIEMPGPPWCIARIHSCGLLWRHFDRGLHLWLLKYDCYCLSRVLTFDPFLEHILTDISTNHWLPHGVFLERYSQGL